MSLAELLVVIAIIAILLALLLSGLGQAVKAAKRSHTLATMNAFASACEAFKVENGYYPGLIPETGLAYNNHQISHGAAGVAISSTENALLQLMGGCIVQNEVAAATWNALLPADGWIEFDIHTSNTTELHFKFNQQKFGNGPVIDGQPHPAYFHPGAGDIAVLDDQVPQWSGGGGGSDFAPPSGGGSFGGGGVTAHLPDLVDGWGHPILYLRRNRATGALVGDAHVDNAIAPQFFEDSLWPYTRAPSQVWDDPCSGGTGSGSILYTNHPGSGGLPPYQPKRGLAQILRHPAFGGDPLAADLPGTALGDIMLISAGPDGVYFSASDGPGSQAKPIGCAGCGTYQAFTYEAFLALGAKAIDEFDDVRVWR